MTVSYKAVRKAPRAKAREKLVGHEWRCDDCNALVHEEPVIGNAGEETEKDAARRVARVEKAKAKHKCPKKKGVA